MMRSLQGIDRHRGIGRRKRIVHSKRSHTPRHSPRHLQHKHQIRARDQTHIVLLDCGACRSQNSRSEWDAISHTEIIPTIYSSHQQAKHHSDHISGHQQHHQTENNPKSNGNLHDSFDDGRGVFYQQPQHDCAQQSHSAAQQQARLNHSQHRPLHLSHIS